MEQVKKLPFFVGLCPLQNGDSCRLLAIDFDEVEWREDSLAFVKSCREFSVPCALEISRSCKGAHVWVFFASSVPASDARSLGAALISHTCSKQRQLELSSYDRLFPNQDRMPSGGFGNLIALPLQKKAREQGASVFVDDTFSPFPDQWAFLSTLVPMASETIVDIVFHASDGRHPLDIAFSYESEDEPWKAKASVNARIPGTLPSKLTVVLSDRIYLMKEQLPQPLLNRIIRLAAFPNPEFYKAQALRLSVWDTPRIIGCAENFPRHIVLPRGCQEALLELFLTNEIKADVVDDRCSTKSYDLAFRGQLRPDQEEGTAPDISGYTDTRIGAHWRRKK